MWVPDKRNNLIVITLCLHTCLADYSSVCSSFCLYLSVKLFVKGAHNLISYFINYESWLYKADNTVSSQSMSSSSYVSCVLHVGAIRCSSASHGRGLAPTGSSILEGQKWMMSLPCVMTSPRLWLLEIQHIPYLCTSILIVPKMGSDERYDITCEQKKVGYSFSQ